MLRDMAAADAAMASARAEADRLRDTVAGIGDGSGKAASEIVAGSETIKRALKGVEQEYDAVRDHALAAGAAEKTVGDQQIARIGRMDAAFRQLRDTKAAASNAGADAGISDVEVAKLNLMVSRGADLRDRYIQAAAAAQKIGPSSTDLARLELMNAQVDALTEALEKTKKPSEVQVAKLALMQAQASSLRAKLDEAASAAERVSPDSSAIERVRLLNAQAGALRDKWAEAAVAARGAAAAADGWWMAENAGMKNRAEVLRIVAQRTADATFQQEAYNRAANDLNTHSVGSGIDSRIAAGMASARNQSELLRVQMQRTAEATAKARAEQEALNRAAEAMNTHNLASNIDSQIAADRARAKNASELLRIAMMTKAAEEDAREASGPSDIALTKMEVLKNLAQKYRDAVIEAHIATGGGGGGVGASKGLFGGVLPGGARASAASVTTALGIGLAAAPVIGLAGAGGMVGLTAAIGSLVGTVGTFKLAFDGISKAAFTNQKAFDALNPVQQKFVQTLRSLDAGLGKTLHSIAQNTVLPGLTSAISSAVTPASVNTLTTAVKAFSSAISDAAQAWGKLLGSNQFASALGDVLQADARYARDFFVGMSNVADGMVHLMQAAIPLTDWMDRGGIALGKWIDNSIKAAQANGSLASFFDRVKTSIRTLGDLIGSVSHLFGEMFDAIGFDNSIGLVELISDAIRSLGDYVHDNQAAFHDFFSGALQSARDLSVLVGGFLKSLSPLISAVKDVADGIGGWRVVIDGIAIFFAGKMLLSVGWVAKLSASILGLGPATKTAAMEMTAALAPVVAELEAISIALGGGAAAVAGGAAGAAARGGILGMLGRLAKIGAITIVVDFVATNLPQGTGSNPLAGVPILGDVYGFGQYVGQSIAGGDSISPAEAAKNRQWWSMQNSLTRANNASSYGKYPGADVGSTFQTLAQTAIGIGQRAPAIASAMGMSGGKDKLLALAKAAVGTPYVWGGSGAGGMDCSGLVMWALANGMNINIGRTTSDMFGKGASETQAQAQPGDLVFTGFGSKGQPEHMGIYAGNGMVYASHGGKSNTAANPGPGVKLTTLDQFAWGGRAPGSGTNYAFQALPGEVPGSTYQYGNPYGTPGAFDQTGMPKAPKVSASERVFGAAQQTALANAQSAYSATRGSGSLEQQVSADTAYIKTLRGLYSELVSEQTKYKGHAKELAAIAKQEASIQKEITSTVKQRTADIKALKMEQADTRIYKDLGLDSSGAEPGVKMGSLKNQFNSLIAEITKTPQLMTASVGKTITNISNAISDGLGASGQGRQAIANSLTAVRQTVNEHLSALNKSAAASKANAKAHASLSASLDRAKDDVAAVTGASTPEIRTQIALINKELSGFIGPNTKAKIQSQISDLKSMISAQIGTLVNAAKDAVSNAWKALNSSVSDLISAANIAFDQQTNAQVTSMNNALSVEMSARSKSLSKQVAAMAKKLQDDLKNMQIMVSGPNGGFMFGGSITQTPTQMLLQQMQDSRESDQLQMALTQATQGLITANATGDPAAIAAARQSLNDAQYAITVANLQKRADAEAKAASDQLSEAQQAYQDAQQELIDNFQEQQDIANQAYQDMRQAEIQNYQDQRAIQKQAMDAQLAEFQALMQQYPENAAGYLQQMLGVFADNGINGELYNATFAIGGSIVHGLYDALNHDGGIYDQIDAVMSALYALAALQQSAGLSNTNGVTPPTLGGGLGGAYGEGGPPQLHGDGGLFTGPTWMGAHDVAGERGREALLPLSNARVMGEIAAAITAQMGGGDSGDIIIQVDGQTIFRASRKEAQRFGRRNKTIYSGQGVTA